ncbi:hypothetical protein CK503_14785 [Aliifodinibius salipaludis]|uniref:Uncharacterized protein n=1 Tax=Fodinibius salipaludis TaxID=2032627 RepID=A0A2A2G7V6_9BACT|nr:hypothetical protein CK503_14785 [Aliifodinibius salipaludis]
MRNVVSLPAGLRGLSIKAVSAVKISIFQPLLGCLFHYSICLKAIFLSENPISHFVLAGRG